MPDPTSEQAAVIGHDPTGNARVLAGPGTGKSWTAVQYLEELGRTQPGLRTRMLTFTRAATADFAEKLGDAALEGLGVTKPATIHAFALGLLMRTPAASGLPQPVRIAGTWERRVLIRPALRDRVREIAANPGDVDVRTIEKLERWMAAGWESLDPEVDPDDDLDPQLTDQFTGIWNEHRKQFGYALIGEIPYRAGQMVDDLQLDDFELDLLLVDEYQDLNRADIRLLERVAASGVALMAIGDDDQSIYSFRKAHPAGIRNFPDHFAPATNYPLTVSHRCGGDILDAATGVITASPGRAARKPLTPAKPGGTFAYLRYGDEQTEAAGVARIIADRIEDHVSPRDIAVLVRSNLSTWSQLLTPELEKHGIALASTDWVVTALMEDDELRRGLAMAWLALDEQDSLAWWTLLVQTRGVGDSFIDHVTDTMANNETFAEALLRLHEEGFPDGPRSSSRASTAIDEALEAVRQLNTDNLPPNPHGWGAWVIDNIESELLTDDGRRLFEMVGAEVPESEGLRVFLSQLEPLGSDLAAKDAEGVRLMTMSSSKGLTFNTAITMGVEEGIVPMPRGEDREERRLLYVAMTRATDVCIVTWAQRRTGTTAHLGRPSYGARRQSPILRDLRTITCDAGEGFDRHRTT